MEKTTFLFLFIFVFISVLFAEDITITTYYPSPYGSYNEMRVNMLAVGSSYQDIIVNPLSDGRLIVSNNLSIGRNTVGNYDSINTKLDVNGYGAVNDLWLKSPKSGAPAGWVSNLVAGLKVMTGSYWGTGTAGRKINTSFSPVYLFLQSEGNDRVWKITNMGNLVLGDDGGASINCVTSFYDQGFVLGSYVKCNSLGHLYYYFAIGE
ncbi:MAG: hypothetical protein PHC93_04950 [Candidatus Omnitrophica bacterium]|nr:hypothetical protein [Candidatus Omnitrophota bacterium]